MSATSETRRLGFLPVAPNTDVPPPRVGATRAILANPTRPTAPNTATINTRLVPRSVTPESVTTLLSPQERARVDAAGEGCFVTLHRESVEELLNDLRLRRASTVLVSVAHYASQHTPPVSRLVREFPRVAALALLTGSEPSSTQAVLSLGQQGVRALVDVRDSQGWRELRRLITQERAESIERVAAARMISHLTDAPEDCQRFFEALFVAPPSVSTVRHLSRRLGVLPSTLMSRFFRAALPAPKRYLATARLVRAARLFENTGLSIAQVAIQLEYSSPQSFSRHIQTLLQCTAVTFRRQYDGESMLNLMCEQIMLPYLEQLRTFHPLEVAPGWMGRDT
jgi:AraC-like DNA-binding protein